MILLSMKMYVQGLIIKLLFAIIMKKWIKEFKILEKWMELISFLELVRKMKQVNKNIVRIMNFQIIIVKKIVLNLINDNQKNLNLKMLLIEQETIWIGIMMGNLILCKILSIKNNKIKEKK